jgi:septal ring factor EnvC (AmiA/AmiB activator)
MDVDAVLLSVQERDKWRHRLGLLEQSLEAVRAKRLRWESRLKRLEAELRRLADYSDALLEQNPAIRRSRSDGAADRRSFPR